MRCAAYMRNMNPCGKTAVKELNDLGLKESVMHNLRKVLTTVLSTK
jgi:hypothetical protein